jgi:hypothetical protein
MVLDSLDKTKKNADLLLGTLPIFLHNDNSMICADELPWISLQMLMKSRK